MESSDEDDAFTMGEREWQKMSRDMSKQGYREGKSEGRERGLQQSFESAASLALNHSMKLGQLQGLIEWSLGQSENETQRKGGEALMVKVSTHLDNLKSCPVFHREGGDKSDPTDQEKEWTTSLQELGNEYATCFPKSANTVASILQKSD